MRGGSKQQILRELFEGHLGQTALANNIIVYNLGTALKPV